jgi:predicted CoA-binding protein
MKQLKEKSIAVVGVSADPSKFGNKIFSDLVKGGYDVRGVNPKGGAVAGKELFRSLTELKPPPELVITTVPPGATEKTVDDCVKLGIKEIWMQPGSESPRAVETARAAGISVIQHSCVMLDNELW